MIRWNIFESVWTIIIIPCNAFAIPLHRDYNTLQIKGVDEAFHSSNLVCDNQRIDETTVHTIIIYGRVPHSTFFSQGRSLVREESVTQFSRDVNVLSLRRVQR